jgi:hypothetical protein
MCSASAMRPGGQCSADHGTRKVPAQEGYTAPTGSGPPSASKIGWGRPELPATTSPQRLRWSAWVWSPPPESNRRPHPYHGTTRNRCAERRFPWSLATVGTKVIGSLSAKECALPQPMCGSSLELAIIPVRVRDRELSPPCLPLIISRSPSEAGVSNLGSMTGHQARRPRPVRPPPGSLRRRPRPATLRSLAPARYRRGTDEPMAPVVVGAARRARGPSTRPCRGAALTADPTAPISTGWSGCWSSAMKQWRSRLVARRPSANCTPSRSSSASGSGSPSTGYGPLPIGTGHGSPWRIKLACRAG